MEERVKKIEKTMRRDKLLGIVNVMAAVVVVIICMFFILEKQEMDKAKNTQDGVVSPFLSPPFILKI